MLRVTVAIFLLFFNGTYGHNNWTLNKIFTPKNMYEIQEQIKLQYHVNPKSQNELNNLLAQSEPFVPNFDENIINLNTKRFEDIRKLYEMKKNNQTLARTKVMNILRKKQNTANKNKEEKGKKKQKKTKEQKKKDSEQKAADKQKNAEEKKRQEEQKNAEKNKKGSQTQKPKKSKPLTPKERALNRAFALMTQFIYAARYKLQYGQILRKAYKDVLEYQIGYCFALMRDIRMQQMMLYTTMHFNYQKHLSDHYPTEWERSWFFFWNWKETYSYADFESYFELYEKIVKLDVNMLDVGSLVQKLIDKRMTSTTAKVNRNTSTTAHTTTN